MGANAFPHQLDDDCLAKQRRVVPAHSGMMWLGLFIPKIPAAEVLNTEAPQKIIGCCSLLCREICEA